MAGLREELVMSLPKIKERNHVVLALQKRQAGAGRHEKTIKAKRRLDKVRLRREMKTENHLRGGFFYG
jgi:hypothetical protein